VDDPVIYDASLAALRDFTRGSYYGRLVQIFLACKHYGSLIPRIGDPTGTDIGTFQRLLDELYEKPSKRPNSSVVSLFSNNHLARTSVALGGRGPANIWRNNFNIQKGFGCYGTRADFTNPTFRTQSRKNCPHLLPATAGTLAGARCSLENQAQYRGDDHPKVFRIDPSTRDIFVYDPTDVTHYAPIVLAPGGRRLPIGPLIVALYFDSPVAAGRSQVDIADFLLDFDFTQPEFTNYFDDDPALPLHRDLASKFPRRLSWTRVSAILAAAIAPLPGIPLPATPSRIRRRTSAATVSTPTPPPAGSHWWDAEQAVRQVLQNDGWTVIDKSRFGVGYDLLAWKAGTTRHVEVKSSAGRCAPSLTDNEYLEARKLRHSYVVAVVENFDPAAAVTVLWVQDPASLKVTARNTVSYSLARSQWIPKASLSCP